MAVRSNPLKCIGPQDITEHSEEFKKNMEILIEYVCNSVKTLKDRQVFPDLIPGDIVKQISEDPPENPECFQCMIDDFEKVIMPETNMWTHPYFFAYFPVGNTFPCVLGDILSTTCGGIGFSWAAQPSLTELESLTLDWYAKAMDLPPEFCYDLSNGVGGGTIQNSASDSCHQSVLAARYLVLEKMGYYKNRTNNFADCMENHPANGLSKLVCYVNREAHSSQPKGANIALCTVRILDPDEHDSMTGEILEKAILADIEDGLVPIWYGATLGTTGGVAFDELTTIGPICQKYNMWLHVDAAYAGSAFVCEEYRYLKNGIEYADSICVNPYKLLLASIDLSCFFIKNLAEYQKAFLTDSVYSFDEHNRRTDSPEKMYEIDYRSLGISMARRMRALRLWCVFRSYGISGIQSYIRNITSLAKLFEKLVLSDKRFEVVNDVYLGLVCFRQVPNILPAAATRNEESLNNITDLQNKNLLLRLNKSRKMHLVPATLRHKYILRLSVNCEYESESHIKTAWEIIQSNYVTKLDEEPSESGVQAFRQKHLAYLHPIRPEVYEQYKKSKHFIPDTFAPVLAPYDDNLGLLLSMCNKKNRRDSIRDALDELNEENREDTKE